MFLHLGRTLSEACKVFTLRRIWLGAANFLTFRDSAQHKLQTLRKSENTTTYKLFNYLFTLITATAPSFSLPLSLSHTHTFHILCCRPSFPSVYPPLILAALFSIKPLHQHISDSASTYCTLLLQQQTFLLVHFTYVTGVQLMTHMEASEEDLHCKKWKSLSLICW
jgi:hypothetical protein